MGPKARERVTMCLGWNFTIPTSLETIFERVYHSGSTNMLDISSHDIVMVGGGGAGLRAAIAVSETNPKLSVAVVSKVYPMRSHTVAAEGGAAGVAKPDDSLDEHCYDTISGGDWLCDQDAVEAFVREAPQEL